MYHIGHIINKGIHVDSMYSIESYKIILSSYIKKFGEVLGRWVGGVPQKNLNFDIKNFPQYNPLII